MQRYFSSLLGIVITAYLASRYFLWFHHPDLAPDGFVLFALLITELLGLIALPEGGKRGWLSRPDPNDLRGTQYESLPTDEKIKLLSGARSAAVFLTIPWLLFIIGWGVFIISFTGDLRWQALFAMNVLRQYLLLTAPTSKDVKLNAISVYMVILFMSGAFDYLVLLHAPTQTLGNSTLLAPSVSILWGCLYYSYLVIRQIWYTFRPQTLG